MVRLRSRRLAAFAKLAPPRLGRVFDRARPFGELDQRAEFPALWIGAAPGAGKSTLAATWLQHRGVPTLWLQLDAGDTDPATFLHALDAMFADAGAVPDDWPAYRADDATDLGGWLRRRLRIVLQHLPAPWVLVLDNHQELGPDSTLHEALAACLNELPHGVQWIFISREAPPPAYARALVQQQLAVLDADCLRFDATEILALTRLHGRPDAMAEALAVAEGWAGGLTLMLLGSARDAWLPALGARDRLFDYFAGEVLQRMPSAEQHALCAIASLPSATAEMAVALSGYAKAPELLERLASSSLFTDRRHGPPTAWVFHALFSAFLRRRFDDTHDADARQALQRRAGLLLAEAGQIDDALARLLDAGCWADGEAVLGRAAADFVAHGRTDALRRHIDRLPDAARRRLAYWRGFSLLDSDPAGALVDLEAAFAERAEAGDDDGPLAVAAAASIALVTLGRIAGLDRWIAVLDVEASRALRVRDEDADMRVIPGLLAALVYRQPWHPLADPLAERAERLLHRESAPGQRLLLGSLAFHLLWRGEVDRLDRIVLRIDVLSARQLAAPATRLRWWGVGILVKTLLGRHAAALIDAEQALALVAAEPSVAAHRTAVELMRMLVALACADAVAARRHMERAAQALHPDSAVDRSVFEHQRGILALLEDDRPTALRLMRASVASARIGGNPMREHIALIANLLAAARSDAHVEAKALWDEVTAHPFYAFQWHRWIGGMVGAYAAWRRGDETESLTRLRGALAVARACGFRHGPMLFCCGDMMARLAALALTHDIEADVARDIVLRNALPAPPNADARWPWTVRVHAFGGLRITLHDEPPASGRKESRRLLDLLALLVANGDAPLTLDEAADELWPDADGDAARKALENALHRLRKLLGGEHRIVLRQGALTLDSGSCWTDVSAVERLLSRLQQADAAGAPAVVDELRTLYRAPLLPSDERARIAKRRQSLHQRLQRALAGAAERLDAGGESDAARSAREFLGDL